MLASSIAAVANNEQQTPPGAVTAPPLAFPPVHNVIWFWKPQRAAANGNRS